MLEGRRTFFYVAFIMRLTTITAELRNEADESIDQVVTFYLQSSLLSY